MIITSPNITNISQALLKFQGAVEGVDKSKVNPAFKSKYATLENVRDTAVPELQAVGVFYIQSPGAIVDGSIGMTTRLIHAESGEWIEGSMDIPLGKKDPQGAGSAITYASRYHLMAMLGLPAVDDDAETAIDRNDKRKTQPPVQPLQEAVRGLQQEKPVEVKRLSKENSRPLFTTVQEKFRTAQTVDAIEKIAADYGPELVNLDEGFAADLRKLFREFRADLAKKEAAGNGIPVQSALDSLNQLRTETGYSPADYLKA